jgi:hypothetical protein
LGMGFTGGEVRLRVSVTTARALWGQLNKRDITAYNNEGR